MARKCVGERYERYLGTCAWRESLEMAGKSNTDESISTHHHTVAVRRRYHDHERCRHRKQHLPPTAYRYRATA